MSADQVSEPWEFIVDEVSSVDASQGSFPSNSYFTPPVTPGEPVSRVSVEAESMFDSFVDVRLDGRTHEPGLLACSE